MITMTSETVRVARIDTTLDTYRISTEGRVEDLLGSIRDLGLLRAPILWGGPSGFQIVSGFRRITACRQLNIQQIPSRIMAPETTPLDRAQVAISENLHQRPLNLIELSRAYALLFSMTEPPDQTVRVADRLGLPSNFEYMNNTRHVCQMAPSLQNAILSDTVALPMAVELSQLPKSVADVLVALFQDLKLSLNRQREIMKLFREISARDGISLTDLIDGTVSRMGEMDETFGSAELSRWLRADLKRRRYPNITRAESEFQQLVHQLRLGQGIKLIPPKDFEGTTYNIEVGFDSPETLHRRAKRLVKAAENPGLARLIKGGD